MSGRVQLILAATLPVMLAGHHGRWRCRTPTLPTCTRSRRTAGPRSRPAAAVLVWGFAGWEAVTSLAADFRQPAPDRAPGDRDRGTSSSACCTSLIAATSILVLGPRTGTTPAPLAELLAIAVGGPVKVITAVIAVLLTFGAMNAYFAGASQARAPPWAGTARCPSWLAHGSEVGDVPRRSLAVARRDGRPRPGRGHASAGSTSRQSVLITTGSFVLVYILGTASAVKLLPRRSWVRAGAMVALVSAIALMVITGWYVLWPLVVAGAALVYTWRRTRRQVRQQPSAIS